MKTFVFHNNQIAETEDHILEFLYDKEEKSKLSSLVSIKKLFNNKISGTEMTGLLQEMQKRHLINNEKGEIVLTQLGRKKAEELVRGHRLAQRLMVDVLGISAENAVKAAHYMEHILESEILEALSAFLGHPDKAPDGKKIPLSSIKPVFSLKPLLCKLSEMEIGKKGKVRYIQNPEKSLANIGLLPGEEIRLIQKRPTIIVEIGNTTVALDPAIARDIYMQIVEN